MTPPIIWKPSLERAETSLLFAMMKDEGCNTYEEFYRWSVEQPDEFWSKTWGALSILGTRGSNSVRELRIPFYQTEWFPDSKLNFARNLMRSTSSLPALISWNERGQRGVKTFSELSLEVRRFALALRESGVEAGDRVCAIVPNIEEAVIAMLGTAAVGAVWSSCSPDFGETAILDRFSQIDPKVLVVSSGYLHRGKQYDLQDKVDVVASQLKSLKTTVIIPYELPLRAEKNGQVAPYQEFLGALDPTSFVWKDFPFNHPLIIAYSSGTTGKPKCIVHRTGGVLIEQLKELSLHTDIRAGERIFYQTTCGWMMWNWLMGCLGLHATICLFDGDPLFEDGFGLWRMADELGVSVFGTNAKYLALLDKSEIKPADKYPLAGLRTVLSTGSPLAPESFDFVHRSIKEGSQISSISGGTDILGCFALGNPLLPVYRGELQCRSLGLDVGVFSPAGTAVLEQPGELVCQNSFPSMPLKFWGDPANELYKRAYFDRFPGAWHHGDLVTLTSRGTMLFLGRSDAVLNPSGVRIGTAEIYQAVETLPEILESLVAARRVNNDDEVVLFVVLRANLELDSLLIERLKSKIKSSLSPFHVPKRVIKAPALPRTRNGKLAELSVRDSINGKAVINEEALMNPECLKFFQDLIF